MPPRGRNSKKFKLGLRDLRHSLATAEAEAEKAVASGIKAIADAKKRGDKGAIARHTVTLLNARRAKENLGQSVHLLALACCDQVLNCDPDFS